MAKKMLIDATHAEETRVVVVDGNKVEEFDFESENKRQLAGNIYLAKVTRVEPSLQAAFVDYGGNRHGFLAFSEIHPDYYQIPVADRQALMEEEAALAAAEDEDDKPKKSRSSRSRSRSKSRSKSGDRAEQGDEAQVKSSDQISGMETIDLGEDSEAGAPGEGLSPMETVHEAPVADPDEVAAEQAAEAAEAVETPSEADAPAQNAAPEAEAPAQDAPAAAVEEVVEEPALEAAAPAEIAEGPAEIASTEESTPEVTPLDEGAAEGDAAEADADSEDKPQRPMAEGAKEEDAVVTAEPAEVSQDAPAEAEADADAAQAAEQDAPEAREVAAEDASDAPNAKADTAEDTAEEQADAEELSAPKRSSRSRSRKSTKSEKPETTEPEDRDDEIESVADDDTEEDIRPVRKPRPRRYKIQEVIKVRQIMLVQVVKEERGNKGAALTTYLSLAGRYCVLMPNTARGGGISRKITNAADRSKLKAIANEIDVPKGAGLIVRTAGAKRTKTEIKRDYEYLQRLWEQIRELTLKSIAPAKIYEEGDLIKRSIRDLYNRDIDEVFVEGEGGYRIAKDFMKMIMPSHAKNVKHYQDQMPLFARYQVESYLGGMFNPVVQLKSGGYIVIGVTEALVAIDVNSGRATKEGSIEETALKTNLEAAEEVARQLRLRDLAGLIVIDFIDMDERKNNAAVEKRIKDKLKTDRARIQVGRISGFGLMEMSRQRLRPGMIEATTQPCPACHGTGLIRSDDNLALQVLRQIEEEGVRRRSREVLVKVPVGIANYLMNQKREHIAQIEARYGMSVRVEGDPHLVSPDFTLEKFKTATRSVPEATAPVVSVDSKLMEQLDEEAAAEAQEIEDAEVIESTDAPAPEAGSEEDKPKKKRRRRSRSRSRSKSNGENGDNGETADKSDTSDKPDSDGQAIEADGAAAEADGAATEVKPQESGEEAAETDKPKKSRSRSRSRSRSKSKKDDQKEETQAEAQSEAAPEAPAEAETPAPVAAEAAPAEDAPAQTPEPAAAADTPAEEPKAEAPAAPEPTAEAPTDDAPKAEDAKPKRTRVKASDIIAQVMGDTAPKAEEPEAEEAKAEEAKAEETPAEDAAPEPVAAEAEPQSAEAEEDKPKRRGWWSLGR
ncbi:Rne/Rng family ribonuclease [Tropicibacter naphthalenivorans]|uniref:Ribonuclease E n=1 Tax=Tropicibacter naphthalenivorans TaxID=441103 RepID=A0A0P1GNV2_9RHOB|nr:ribonuclease E/G [Tropicibacter naphthalenivorans]CUH76958.1 Ribonuclease E [Tropicibacter naphthalenivorans]SMC61983.1 RNAse E [Tropicibacter naphthalenivorans]